MSSIFIGIDVVVSLFVVVVVFVDVVVVVSFVVTDVAIVVVEDAVFVSLGFALIENILYVFQGGMTVAIARAFTAVPAHGFFAVIMGYYFSLSKFHADDDQRKGFLIKALLFPILVHGTYNFCLMYMSHENANPLLSLLLMLLFTIVVIGFWIIGIRKIKKHIQKDKDLGLIG